MNEPVDTLRDEDIDVDTGLDEDDRLRPSFVRAVLDFVEKGETEEARDLVRPLHPADVADLFELADEDERAPLAAALGDILTADVLSEMNDYVREDIIDELAPAQVAVFASALETDDAVAIIEDMDAADQQAVLAALDAEDRAAIEDALSYPEETAGRLMQRDLVAVPEHYSVGQVIDMLRVEGDIATDFYEVFVVDPLHRPVGTCMLSWIMRTPRNIAMTDVMQRDQTLIPVDMDQEEVALRFQKYALISAAVVDGAGRLVGMITVDDILHIVQEEAAEDALLLSGAGEGDINMSVGESYAARVRWLVANLGTALVASTIIYLFGAAIEKMVALAVLMPIVASIGGNAGTQTMAVSVRALAMNQLTQSNSWRVVQREMRIALLNGATVALLVATAAGLFYADPVLGLVIGAAILFNVFVAGLAGVLIPVVLDRLDQDPAVASSVFVTMVTDSIGFLAFLGLAVASGLVSL
ncbi:MAG: magnesium transporter [Sphingomonadales bacterium]|nr:magnesium transporter [Sphingomonadales bacterium]